MAGERMDRVSLDPASQQPQNFDSAVHREHAALFRDRGRGLMLGVVLTSDVAKPVETAARDAGFLVNAPAPNVIRLVPPLILTDAQVGDFLGAFPKILDAATRIFTMTRHFLRDDDRHARTSRRRFSGWPRN